MQSVDSNNGKNFWKKSNKMIPGRAVYGAMHPPIVQPGGKIKQVSPLKEARGTGGAKGGAPTGEMSESFRNYWESVNDAWECSDDEFTSLADGKISNDVAQSTALSVINRHRSGQLTSSSINNTARKDFASNSSSSYPTDNKKEGSANTAAVSVALSFSSENFTSTNSSSTNSCNTAATTTAGVPSAAGGSPGTPTHFILPSNHHQHNNLRERLTHDPERERESGRLERFEEVLHGSKGANVAELRKLSWSGIPPKLRADTWRTLNGYLPANNERREETLGRKREEYWNFVKQYYHTRHDDLHTDTFRQIHIDIPRMSPLISLLQQPTVQEMFERILFIWAIRHPASGYVQGINDLVIPFFVVFLSDVIPPGKAVDTYDVACVNSRLRDGVEADSFWCLSRLLDGIQDNYTFAQPGIQTRVTQLRELVTRIDDGLHRHLERHGIDYLQFSFRWFNNVLMRELPLSCTVRLWDTLHAEQEGFSHFLLYVAAAFLKHFSQQLMVQTDFQGLMLLLQNLPTSNWTDSEISLVVAEAFRLKYMFADAPKHLYNSQQPQQQQHLYYNK
uniref:TBC1 domain family member 22B-like n=2 Tax=Hirondellea gigas TaxID=1518452 RepID=A0A2P2I4D6_9CRUS